MYKQSPSRNHRSKGIKVKHILQICLLLAVCFWLIYQVKHSQEKRKQFDAKDGKVVGKIQTDGDVQRFGRKDLPRVAEITRNIEKHGEDEEEKEVEEEEEENKHEEDEPEKDDSKHEEEGDRARGGGDDEIDENDTERTDTEPEHEEELLDEDKEREENVGASEEHHTETEENEDVGKGDHSENEEKEDNGKEDHAETEENEDGRGEDHNDGVHTKDHEAREEQYKADDASSEVAQNIQTFIPETGNRTTGQTSEMWSKVNFGEGNETQTSDKDDAPVQSGVHPREDMNNTVTTSNPTLDEQKKYEIDSKKSENNTLQNSTLPSLSNDQPESRSNSTDATGEYSAALLSNGTRMELPSSLSQNATGDGTTLEGEHTSKPELAEVGPDGTENVNSNAGESLNPSNTTSDPSHKTNGTYAIEAGEGSSLHLGERLSNIGASGSDEGSKSQSSEEVSSSIQHDPTNLSNASLTKDTRESSMDSGTLPKIRTDVQNTVDAAAE